MPECQLIVPEAELERLLDEEHDRLLVRPVAARAPRPFRVVPCSEWGARLPAGPSQRTGRPHEGIFHHTYGLARGLDYVSACAYARAIQAHHMGQGWRDSGHNFLVTRGGYILEGRRGSLAELLAGRFLESAHCPGHNDQPGVEHEHKGTGTLTSIQREATLWLWALICRSSSCRPDRILPHRAFVATSCPAELTPLLPGLRRDLELALSARPEYVYRVIEADGSATNGRTRWPRLSFARQIARRPQDVRYHRL